ncbi:MAG: hypothetical protein ORN57_04385 [Alphaproteobacteria bacterium]|nr:hypothetical protein [Alphaproteobacteria bacterium]
MIASRPEKTSVIFYYWASYYFGFTRKNEGKMNVIATAPSLATCS